MGHDEGQERTQQLADDSEKSPEQLRAEIEDVRGDLGDTAAALAAKTDVKSRARDKADELKRAAAARKDDLLGKTPGAAPASERTGSALTRVKHEARQRPVLVAAGGALVAGILLGRLMGREG